MVNVYFADTSALAKRYLNEIGTTWVESWIELQANNTIVIAEIALLEMRSLFGRRINEGTLAQQTAATLMKDFLLHTQNQYLLVPLDSHLLGEAGKLLEKHRLRALDSIQLASALQARNLLQESIDFIAADVKLLAAASAEGFAVDDPNNHP